MTNNRYRMLADLLWEAIEDPAFSDDEREALMAAHEALTEDDPE